MVSIYSNSSHSRNSSSNLSLEQLLLQPPRPLRRDLPTSNQSSSQSMPQILHLDNLYLRNLFRYLQESSRSSSRVQEIPIPIPFFVQTTTTYLDLLQSDNNSSNSSLLIIKDTIQQYLQCLPNNNQCQSGEYLMRNFYV